MPKDILTKIVEQKQKEISKARSVVSEKELAVMADKRDDFRFFLKR
jgi:hypothetical protein